MFYKSVHLNFTKVFEKVKYKTTVHGLKTSMHEFFLEKGAVIPVHAHPHEQTGFMVAGKMIFNIGGEEFIAEKGDSWNIPGNVEHHVTALEDCTVIEVFSPPREDYM